MIIFNPFTGNFEVSGPPFNPHSPGPFGDVTPNTIEGTTITATTTFITPSGGSSVNAIHTSGDSTTGIHFSGTTTIITSGGVDIISAAGGLITFETNVNMSNGKQIQFGSNGSPASPAFFLSSPPFPGFYLTNGSGGTIGFSANASTNHLLIQTSIGITCGLILRILGGTSPILTTTSAITSGAGVGLGTLTNAPSAGNPTAWVPINDNGTTRYIPAW